MNAVTMSSRAFRPASIAPAVGGMYITGAAATAFSDIVTPVKAAGTTALAA